jgi:transposase InsO family protein
MPDHLARLFAAHGLPKIVRADNGPEFITDALVEWLVFHSVLEARVVIDEWLGLYNTRRGHRGLGGLTPVAYAKMTRAEESGDRCEGG